MNVTATEFKNQLGCFLDLASKRIFSFQKTGRLWQSCAHQTKPALTLQNAYLVLSLLILMLKGHFPSGLKNLQSRAENESAS